MPVTTELVGAALDPATHHVDARWTMAYAAALGDDLPCYLDTSRPEGVVAHPMFAVCPEWPVIVSGRDASERAGVTADETARSVHATHDLTVHRLIRPGDLLTTTAAYTGVEQRRPGAFVTTRLETRDGAGELVATTVQGNLYLGVESIGEDRPAPTAAFPSDSFSSEALPSEGSDAAAAVEMAVEIAQGAAHTYTECARIWNPIHTDEAIALAAGLPGIILHGTATMALAVSGLVNTCAGGDPTRVRRITGRFGAMVQMPSTIIVRHFGAHELPSGSTAIPYDVTNEDGGAAVDRGIVVIS